MPGVNWLRSSGAFDVAAYAKFYALIVPLYL